MSKGKSYACRDKAENNLRKGDFYQFKHLFFDKGTRRYKRICGIYKIENLITHKIYIGQSKDIYRRFIKHVNCKDMRYELYQDFNKYGVNNFSFEVLKETKDLDYWEVFLIQLHKSNNKKYGYNTTIGGSVLTGKDNPFYGKHHSVKTKNKLAEQRFEYQILCVETGEVFSYAREIERKYGACHSHITRCCKGLAKTCLGMHWKFIGYDKPLSNTTLKGNRYYFLCKDTLKNDVCYYYILANRIRRHKKEYKNVQIGNCIVEERYER